MSAQPAEREDPLDPQQILDQLPTDERGFLLDQYREAVENARDPVRWKQLRRVLLRWRLHADAVRDPAYREALDAARGPVGGGCPGGGRQRGPRDDDRHLRVVQPVPALGLLCGAWG